MPLVLADRVRETSTTTGTGTLTLAGAAAGFQTFSSAIGNGNTCYYAVVFDSDYEIGLGTVGAGTLARTTVLQSSNSDALVNFPAGTKDVFVTYPADKAVFQDASGKVSGYAIESSTVGATTPAAGTFTTLIGGKDQVNYAQVTGGATTKAVEFKSLGSDTNVAYAIRSQGTGAIDLAAGSSGVNISNGGTVAAITRTAGGTGYTTAPTVTISPPTTAGGVQATATCTITGGVVDTTFTITNAGSGYVEQPTVSFSGGGGSGAAAYATVGSGTVVRSLGSTALFYTPGGTAFGLVDNGQTAVNYWGARGGGAGIAPNLTAYSSSSVAATIDNNQANSINFRTNTNVTQMVVSHTASAVNYVQVTGGATGNPANVTVAVGAASSDTNVNLNLNAKGTGRVLTNAGITATGTVQAQAASTQDAVILSGRAGGTGSFAVTLTPTTLTASRTVTLPDAAGTAVLDTATQTLTNKTVASPTITGTPTETVFALTDGATVDVVPANGSIQTLTLAGTARTMTWGGAGGTNFGNGQAVTLMINDGTAGTITTWNATWVNNGGAAPTLSTTAYTVVVVWKVAGTVYAALVGNA